MDRLRQRYVRPDRNRDRSQRGAGGHVVVARGARAPAAGGRAGAAADRGTRRVDAVLSRGFLWLADIAEALGVPVGTVTIASLPRTTDVAAGNGRRRFTHMTHHTPPAALASELRRLTILAVVPGRAGGLRLPAAWSIRDDGHRQCAAAHGAIASATHVGSARRDGGDRTVLGEFCGVGADPEANPAGQGPDRRQPPGRRLQRRVRCRLPGGGGDHWRGGRSRGDGAGPSDARRSGVDVDSGRATVRTTDQRRQELGGRSEREPAPRTAPRAYHFSHIAATMPATPTRAARP